MQAGLQIFEYLNAIFRYRLVVLCTAVVGLIITVSIVRMLPDVFTSTTLIMVEPQDVPESYVRATMTERLEKRLQQMSQEVLSRTRLEGIINDFGLYADLRKQHFPVEQLVEMMRRKVNVQVYAENNAFRISYEGSDPAIVQQVTARLAGHYIDENLRIREEHVTGTTEFMESELEKAKRQLEDQESQIQGFKQKYMGELPEQREANMRALEGSRIQLQTISTALSAAMERKLLLDKQAAEARSVRSVRTGADGQPAAESPSARLRQLEAQLIDLKGRYTREHPDVIQTESQIARLRAEMGAPDDSGAQTMDPLVPPELARAVLQAQIEITRLKDDEERVKKGIEMYQGRVENAFVREQELQGLTRDYEVTHRKYQTLLDKKLEAQLSQSLERRQKAERFRVLDPASRPQAPTRPNRQALMVGGAGASLGLALFLPILLWQLDSSFHLPEECAASGLPVLGVISRVHTPDVDQRLRRYRIRVLGCTALGLIIGLGSATLYAKYVF